MAEMHDLAKVAVDLYKGRVEKYSLTQANDLLREAAIEANGGSTVLNYKNIRDGKCQGLFTLIEEVLDNTVVEGLTDNMFFNNFVDFRNVALGDKNIFVVNDNNLFVVDEVAEGTQAIRRQRLGGLKEQSIPTSPKAIRIYEELNRVLAGRVDFNHMINLVSDSIQQQLLNDIYSLWVGITASDLGGSVYFPAAGDYDEDTLLDLIAHVEAASGGQNATIVGTKKGLRKLKESIMSDGAKEEFHNMGYVGRFFGTPCVAIPQRHKIGSTDFVLDDNVLTIVAGDDKMLKVVYEGDTTIIMGDPTKNMDLTQEYFALSRWGTGIVTAGNYTGMGRYDMNSN